MGAAVEAATARLVDRMARARREAAVRQRFVCYVLPIGLVAISLFITVEAQIRIDGFIPITPLLAAAIYARVFGGVVAGRVATALVAPISIYIGWEVWEPTSPSWFASYMISLSGLCVGRVSIPQGLQGPLRQLGALRSERPLALRRPQK